MKTTSKKPKAKGTTKSTKGTKATQTKLKIDVPKSAGAGTEKAKAPPKPVEAATAEDSGKLEKWEYAKLKPGKNARTDFDPVKLAELANAIHLNGLQNPPTIYPDGEIHGGERRYRALGILIKDGRWQGPVPVMVRADAGDAERQVVGLMENLQREDLNPIDKAEGLQAAIRTGKFVAWDEKNPERSLGHQLGYKSKSTIHALLNLAGLCTLAKEAARRGPGDARGITPAVADKLARIRDPKLQAQATTRAIHQRWTDDKAAELISAHYQRQLKGAQFDPTDATLVPLDKETGIGGPCGGCMARSGNQAELFGEFDGKTGRGDMCLNTACYRKKVTAAYLRAGAALEKMGGEAKPLSWMDGKDPTATRAGYGYVMLREKHWHHPGKTYGQVLKEGLENGEMKLVLMPFKDEAGEMAGWHEVVHQGAAAGWEARQKKKAEAAQPAPPKGAENKARVAASALPSQRRAWSAGDHEVYREHARRFRKGLVDLITGAMPEFNTAGSGILIRMVVMQFATMLWENGDFDVETLEVLGMGGEENCRWDLIAAKIQELGVPALAKVLTHLIVIDRSNDDAMALLYQLVALNEDGAEGLVSRQVATAAQIAAEWNARDKEMTK